MVSRISAHEGAIYAISATAGNGGMYITASKDGKVKVWRPDFQQQLYSFKTAVFSPRPSGVPVHTAVLDNRGSTALIGMRSGEVFELALQNQSHFLLLESHSVLELHAIAANPQVSQSVS